MHQASVDEPALIQIRQVRYREIDYGDLTVVDQLVRDLVAGEIDRDEASARLARIVSSGHARPRWSVTAGFGVMGAGVGIVLGGDWRWCSWPRSPRCSIDLITRAMSRRRLPAFYQQIAGGLFAHAARGRRWRRPASTWTRAA